ncbi:MAG: histidine--tRNA ligase [Phycisphaerales bacterium]|nr:histidine--tRNA ligase [Phycisphaerales bacterium]
MGTDRSFQRPKGTRDFLPDAMAVRRHIECAWRDAAIRHGFEEIDGPTFEHLDLYTVKSGDGIVSELFSFQRSGGDVDYALRPEFTPTLARMAAAQGRSLATPTKWFAIPDLFRAERPQRGRLREHRQWNVDCLGLPGHDGDAEVIAVAVTALRQLGLTSSDVRVRINHRGTAAALLSALGVPATAMDAAFTLVDKRAKMPSEAFAKEAASLGLDAAAVERLDAMASCRLPGEQSPVKLATDNGLPEEALEALAGLSEALERRGLLSWCDWDPGIVRGLAYYTGTVWEIHDLAGAERAVAGGGRYDKLVSLFGGPEVPACGFGMGDVVLGLLLEDKGLLDESVTGGPRPDVFIASSGSDEAEDRLIPLATALRDSGLHVRHTHKATRNIGKQLREASGCRARFVLILGDELSQGQVVLKDLDGGTQQELPLADVHIVLRRTGG